MPGTFAALTHRGQRRTSNQDQALARELPGGLVLLAVADGVGGMGGGDLASAEAMRGLLDDLTVRSITDPEAALQSAVATANLRVRELARESDEHTGMATTLVAALIGNNQAWIASLGDSRAYVLDSIGYRQVTSDDSWVAEQVRAGLLNEEEAKTSPRQNVITRAIGIEDELGPETIITFGLLPGAFLLLCSDGLYRVVDDAEVAALLLGGEVSEAVVDLIDRANDAGGPDNIGIAVYQHTPGGTLSFDTPARPEQQP